MKTSNLIVKIVMVMFLCAAFAGGLVYGEGKAFADCKGPGAQLGHYKTCEDCMGSCSNGTMTGCDPDVNNDNSITTVDLQIILKCVKMKCKPTVPKYACYDLNKDGKIDMTDYNIV